MRWLLMFLLVINVFYYVWQQQQAPIKEKGILPEQSYIEPRLDIRLLRESADIAQQIPAGSPVNAGEASCITLGEFNERLQAESVEQRLVSMSIAVSLLEQNVSAGIDYWVYLPPLASSQASLRQLRELQGRMIDSYLITEGDLENGISLGIFPRSSSAEAIIEQLRVAGYEPQMRELQRTHRTFWVQIAPSSMRLVDAALLGRLAQDFPGLTHRLVPCEVTVE
jgi:hypothetical protein